MGKSKLNKRDYLLLEELDKNSRSTLNQLAKRLNISKQAIKNKLDKFEKNNIIINYLTIIDFFSIGYNNVHLYLNIKGINKTRYDEGIANLKNNCHIVWIAEFFGDYNLGVSIFFKNTNELSQTIDEIYRTFNLSIIDKEIHYINEHRIQNIYFSDPSLRETIILKNNQKSFLRLCEIEKRIIDFIKDNSRFTYLELSQIIDKKRDTTKRYIIDLEQKEVIKKYKLLINYNQLGRIWSLCIIRIFPGESIGKLLEELQLEQRIPFISKTIEGNLIVDFLSENYTELKEYLNSLKERYNSTIQNFRILNLDNVIKLQSSRDS